LSYESSHDLSYVLGVVFGDGYLYCHGTHYTIGLDTTDCDFARRFRDAISRVLRKKIYLCYDRSRERYRVFAWSRHLYCFLKHDLDYFKAYIEIFPHDFIRGFADSEGCVYFGKRKDRPNSYKKWIQMTNSDLQLLTYVGTLLSKFKIYSKIREHKTRNRNWKRLWNLVIERNLDIRRFKVLIGFSIKRKNEKLKKILEVITN